MKRTIKQSLIFSVVVHVLFFVGAVAFGYIRTLFYVPDVVNAYQEVTYLQKEVAFGQVSPITSWPFWIISLLLTSSVFILCKKIFGKLRSKTLS